MTRHILFAPLALGCSTYPIATPPSCDQSFTPIDTDDVASIGLSASEAADSFPVQWDVTWARHDGEKAVPLPDVVEADLSAVSAEDGVSHEATLAFCRPAGTKFLRVQVVGSFSTQDGLIAGDLTGWIEAEDADVLDWQFILDAPSVVLAGDDLALAEQFVTESGRIATTEGYNVQFAGEGRLVDPPFILGVSVHGLGADQSGITSALWHSSSLTPR